ncbi:MAG: MCE family protein, partial [Gammaproteobacteria bacterium]|nr:MCE family protein [Gammaproteobacteria bacterium]NIR94866.1 MCE family protein [Gammaproteobacteria bacterium]NIW45882.1 MCE family protein [Gammaproteobacteria bacterium]
MAISTEQKVGLFFLATLILLAVMIELVEDWRPFEEQYAYIANFKSAVGLKVGDPVRIAGVDVGKVESIAIEDQHVRVDFYVNREDSIREDTVAQIRQTNMLGGIFLGLDFGSQAGKILPPGSKVHTESSANIDQLITNLDRNQDRVLRPLGELVDESSQPLTEAINRLENIVSKIDRGEGTLGKLVNNPALYDEMTTMSTRLNQLLARLENGEGTLGKLVVDPSLYDNLNSTMINLAEVYDQIISGKGTLGRLLVDDRLYEEASLAVSNLNKISSDLNEGKGSLGKMLQDEELYDN